MLGRIGQPVRVLSSWMGGWSRLLLLVLFIGAAIGGLIWERQRHVPVPPEAAQVATTTMTDIRQTSFRYPGSIDEVRAFYREVLPERGWRYCGTQATPRCTNLINLIDGSGEVTDVYRRADDADYRGTTVEVSPIRSEDGQTVVTVFETRGR